jgi:holliday junction DNA helicase RuvA
MFEYIKGVLTDKRIGEVVVETGGVGYLLVIPLSTYEKLPPPGQEVKIFAHHYVREDAEKLYGFSTGDERDIFRRIIGISNIGPKTAISILSGVSLDVLIDCVNKSDASRLKKIPGIGEKTAQRLVIELKGKLSVSQHKEESVTGAVTTIMTEGNPRSEAFDALLSLGYAEKQIQNALTRIESVINSNAAVEEWIKKALQII